MFYATDPVTTETNTDSPTVPNERELAVLAHVHHVQSEPEEGEKSISQRSIAHGLGMSLGLTNAILKRLSDKGFLMARRINHNNVHYLVTPEGIDQISRRSYRYLRRTIGHVVRYKERLREFCRIQKERGVREIVLIGESDLTFILEWCCEKEGVEFRQVEEPERMHGDGIVPQTSSSGTTLSRAGAAGTDQAARPGILRVFSEHVLESDDPDAVLLHEVVLGYFTNHREDI